MEQPIVLVIGTRPEGIKLLPLYFALKQENLPVLLCSTTQHSTLLSDVFNAFDVKPDIEFGIMRQNQDLFYITTQVLEKSKQLFSQVQPSCVIVQGDTTTAMGASLAAFYLHIPLGHVEAGLRTKTISCPFPEEMNRRFISMISSLHFAPTSYAVDNLLAEKFDRSTIFQTGNTVVDALRIMKTKLSRSTSTVNENVRLLVEQKRKERKKIIVLTAHRRESFDGGIERILSSIKHIAQENKDCFIFYPFHPNPAVKNALEKVNLSECNNIYVCSPQNYPTLMYILLHADLVATDSGGICEEAVSLGKSVVILREETERMEAVWSGLGFLTGTDSAVICSTVEKLLTSPPTTTQMQQLYGDGYAADKIACILREKFFAHVGHETAKKDSHLHL